MAEPSRQQGLTQSLAGKGIVVTRPQQDGERLAALLADQGATPWLMPVLALRARPMQQGVDSAAARHWIFVSRNAVRFGADYFSLTERASVQTYALGAGTASALREAGFSQVQVPPPDDGSATLTSEQLLNFLAHELPKLRSEFGAEGRTVGRTEGGTKIGSIGIVRGVGGRTVLQAGLQQLGLSVGLIECYERVNVPFSATRMAELNAALLARSIHAVIALSTETLEAWQAHTGSAFAQLASLPHWVPHARVAAVAHKMGIVKTIVSAPDDRALSQSLIHYFAGSR